MDAKDLNLFDGEKAPCSVCIRKMAEQERKLLSREVAQIVREAELDIREAELNFRELGRLKNV